MRENISPARLIMTVLVLLLAIAMGLRWYFGRPIPAPAAPQAGSAALLAEQLAAIVAGEQKMTETVWAPEMLAQKCGALFENLWDDLNSAGNKTAVLQSFPFGTIDIPEFRKPKSLRHGILLFESSGAASMNNTEWKAFAGAQADAGWEISQTEFRHVRFDTDAIGQARQSRFSFSAHLVNGLTEERAALEGTLLIDWEPAPVVLAPRVRRIDASDLRLTARRGPPAFQEVLFEIIEPPGGSYFIDPLIHYDLDGDGLSEVILASGNLVFKRRPDGSFESRDLCRFPGGIIFPGLIADFDADGVADFLCAKFEGVYLFRGAPGGIFDLPGELVWKANPRLRYGQAMACGDIDNDGHLDVFLAQYKVPYERGQMPTPYYDANDGYPSYLLRNDGHGRFTDMTWRSGLEASRWRRAYSASFVDLDNDGDLDLVLVSDFAGLNLYSNDGRGRFTDITKEKVAERHSFGMSQLVADLNSDGLLDLLMIGMNVPVADRLIHLGLARPGFEDYLAMAGPMTYGNRLYLGQNSGGFQQTSLNDSIARTGWSWGCSAFDFDNDGFPDLYLANGHESKQSVRDYEPEFWLHDIYVGNSQDNPAAVAYFHAKYARTRAKGMSYGGYEKNRLLLNMEGSTFLEAGHLMGVAMQEDSRNVMADDLDADGRMDLIVTTFEAWPKVRQTLRIFQNNSPEHGNWIGFRFREEGRGNSPVGARVTLHFGDKKSVQHLTAGDSYRSQRPNMLHFGLGEAKGVEKVEVHWAAGQSLVLPEPQINRYHTILLRREPPLSN
jgi:enediyne biosynthesis protein E4